MTLGLISLLIFTIAYILFAGAIIWHLKTYAFSRSAAFVTSLFVSAALILFIILFSSYFFLPSEKKILESFNITSGY